MTKKHGITEAVRKALINEDTGIMPTRALCFSGSEWLTDDGSAVPLGNSPYTWEFWVRFTGHGCFASIGTGGHGHASGFHFDHQANINHCAQFLVAFSVSFPIVLALINVLARVFHSLVRSRFARPGRD